MNAFTTKPTIDPKWIKEVRKSESSSDGGRKLAENMGAKPVQALHQRDDADLIELQRADIARNIRALRECAELLGDRTPELARLILAGDPAQEAA